MLLLALIAGVALGALGAWLLLRPRIEEPVRELETARGERDAKAAEAAALTERLALVGDLQGQFEDRFKALSAEALQHNTSSFLELAKAQLESMQTRAKEELGSRQQAVERLVVPIKESLERADRQAQQLENVRRQSFGALHQQLETLAAAQERLRAETGNLVTALRAPHVRGRWGEMQLRRVVELAGMIAHCDFEEQSSVRDDEGRLQRPDLIVRLPGGKNVVVDAKAPLDAYLDGIEAADDDIRRARLQDHARQVRDHVTKLSAKRYWQQFSPAPDFVVMFLPDEAFFRTALDHDPSLIEMAWQSGVMLASPTTLITILRTVAYTWQQETVAESARAVSELGRELYERLGTLGKHVAKLGRSLDGAVGAYNEAVGSLETRVLVSARKFEGHGIAGEVPELAPLERQSRPLQALELEPGDVSPAPPARRLPGVSASRSLSGGLRPLDISPAPSESEAL